MKNSYHVKEVKMSLLNNQSNVKYVQPHQVPWFLKNGWILHVNEKRRAKVKEVPNIYKVMFSKLLIDNKQFTWKELYAYYKKGAPSMGNVPSWMNLVWGAMTFGKFPTIHENIINIEYFLKKLTFVGKFMILLLLASPLCAGMAYIIVQSLLYSR